MMKYITLFILFGLLTTTGISQSFTDNFTSEIIGDFPSKWDLLQGSAQVDDLYGTKIIRLGNEGTITPLLGNDDYLSEEFTIEFDIFFDEVRQSIDYQSYELRLWPGVSSVSIDNGESTLTFHSFRVHRYGIVTSYRDSGPQKGREYSNYFTELKTHNPVWRNIKIQYKKGHLKVLMDDQLVLNIPRYQYDPSAISIEGNSVDGKGELIKAVKSFRINGLQNVENTDSTNTSTRTESGIETPPTREVVHTSSEAESIDSDSPVEANTQESIKSSTPSLESQPTLHSINEESRSLVDSENLGINSEKRDNTSSIDSTILNNPNLTRASDEGDIDEYAGLTNGSSEECGFIPTDKDWQVLLDRNSNFNRRLNHIEQQNLSLDDLLKLSQIEVVGDRILLSSNSQFVTFYNSNFIPIPIVAHVLRRSDHTGGLSVEDLLSSIGRANNLFADINVYLHLDKVLYIDNDTFYELKFEDDKEFLSTINLQNVPNKLNIYFTPNSDTSWANFPSKGEQEQHIVMRNSQARNESTLAHEIGHWFNLLHTHDSGRGIDYIGNIYCDQDGDLVCDTPPDPNLSDRVDDSDCRYTGRDTIVSPYGTTYNPDPSLIMSYAPKKCRTRFSDKQTKRMYNAYLGMEQDRGYTFKINREIGENIKNYDWSSGWDNVLTYDMGSGVFLFLLKSSTGDVHIHKFNRDGTVGERIYDKDWTSGWTSAAIFGVGTQKYLFLLKKDTGVVHINKINLDGTIGEITYNNEDKPWTKGWTSVEVINKKHLLLLKSGTGDMHINRLNTSNGTVGDLITNEKWTAGWDVTEVVGNKLILYKSSTGDIHVQELNDQGKFETPLYDERWTSGWSSITYIPSHDNYHQNTFRNLLLMRQSNGQLKQNQWVNGTIGSSWFDNVKLNQLLGQGWGQALFYDVFDGARMQNFVMLMNADTGHVKLYHLNNNLK